MAESIRLIGSAQEGGRTTAQASTSLRTGFNFPSAIERVGANTFYIAQTFDGTIQKITL